MRLYKIGFSFVVIPFVVGLLIYFTWFAALHYFAVKLDELEMVGVYWILISVPLTFAGLVIVLIDLLRGKGANVLRFVLGLCLGLLNIPILIWILLSQGEVSGRAYIKIENHTGKSFYELVIQEPDQETYVGDLDSYESTVSYYNPDYYQDANGSYLGISGNYLLFEFSGKMRKINLPKIHPGEVH